MPSDFKPGNLRTHTGDKPHPIVPFGAKNMFSQVLMALGTNKMTDDAALRFISARGFLSDSEMAYLERASASAVLQQGTYCQGALMFIPCGRSSQALSGQRGDRHSGISF